MKKSNIAKLIFIFIFFIIVLILFSNFNKETNYVNFDYEIETITYLEDNLYLTFVGDETLSQKENGKNIKYAVYGNRVDLSLFKDLKVGDNVNITVEDNYGKFKYTIIYEMKYDGVVLFNIMEDYSELDFNNNILFISFFLSLILYLLFLLFYHEKERENKPTDFIIKNPLGLKYFFIGIIVGSLGFVMPFTILYILKLCDFDYFLYSILFYFFLLIGVFGVYVCIKEKFVLEKEVFSYHKIFARRESVKVKDIKIILIKPNERGLISKLEFYDHDDNKVVSFFDDGTSFRDNLFLTACNKYDIPICVVSKNRYYKVVKKDLYEVNKFIEYLIVLTSGNYNLKITITTLENNIILLKCNYGYLDLLANGKELEIKTIDIASYINFSEKLTVEADIDFTIPLDDQIVIINKELWFKADIR